MMTPNFEKPFFLELQPEFGATTFLQGAIPAMTIRHYTPLSSTKKYTENSSSHDSRFLCLGGAVISVFWI